MKNEHEKIEGGEIVIENRFLRWLDNFWYHYKWTVIVVGFFAIVSIICFVQCAGNEKGDMVVSYAGECTMSADERRRLVTVLESLTPKKANGATGQSVTVNNYLIYDHEKLKESYTDEKGEIYQMGYQMALAESQKSLQTFDTYVGTGDSAIYLISEYVYLQRPDLGRMMRPLSTMGVDTSDCAYSDYAIRLADTAFYQYYQGSLGFLPEDTLLLMPARIVFTDEKAYADYEALWTAIVTFETP